MAFITLKRTNGLAVTVRTDAIIRIEPDQRGTGANIFVKPDGGQIGVNEPVAVILGRLKDLGENVG